MSILDNLGNLDVTKNGGPKVSKIDPSTIPGFVPGPTANGDYSKFRMRYKRFDMQEPGDIIELETIETKAIRNRGVYILSRERFVFMDRILMLVNYLEESTE